MGLIIKKDFDPISALVIEYFKAPGPSLSDGKHAQEKAQARTFGRREGVAEGLAALLTVRRIHAYPLIEYREHAWYEPIMQWDVEEALKPYAEFFPLPRDGKDEVFARISEALSELVLGDAAWRKNYAALRRDLIEHGEIDADLWATDEDRKYWQEQYEAHSAGLAKLKKLSKGK